MERRDILPTDKKSISKGAEYFVRSKKQSAFKFRSEVARFLHLLPCLRDT